MRGVRVPLAPRATAIPLASLRGTPTPAGSSHRLPDSAPHAERLATSSSQVGFLHCTRVLRRPDRKGPATRQDIADALGTQTFTQLGTSPLELNLFEDPTGGLAAGPAEELTTTEVEAQVRLMVSGYDRHVFYLLYTPLVDVVQLVIENGLLPQSAECRGAQPSSLLGRTDSPAAAPSAPIASSVASGGGGGEAHSSGSGVTSRPADGGRELRRPEGVMADWFADGLAVLKRPQQTTAGAMGARRWELLGAALDRFYEPVEEVMPLTRVVRRHGLPEEVYVGFLRQLAMSLVEEQSRRRTIATLPGLVLGLANGRAPVVLALPEVHRERVLLVAELLLGVAQECGSVDLAYLGVQLLRANDLTVPFAFQKQLTNVFSTAARLQTDWQTRSTGHITHIYPRWQAYFCQVRHDNARQLSNLVMAPREGGVAGGEGGGVVGNDTAIGSPVGAEERTVDISAATAGGGGSTDGPSREQHEYFTSRRPADIERVASLEANIDAALRSRSEALAAEVLAMQLRRQRRQRLPRPSLDSSGPSDDQGVGSTVRSGDRDRGVETDDGEPDGVVRTRLGGDHGSGEAEAGEEAAVPAPPKRRGRRPKAKKSTSRRRTGGAGEDFSVEEEMEL